MFRRIALLALGVTVFAAPAVAGVVNPDISVVGQPFIGMTDDLADPSHDRPVLDPGEVELVFDAYLNPYARGTFILTLAEEGLELEEGYFQLLRGLPAGLAIKGGQYRVGFGKLNPQHPHMLPFAERFRVMATYLPGEESLDETGLSLSGRIPMPGTFSLTAAADWLQGDTYRIEREDSGAPNDPFTVGGPEADRPEEARPAYNGRLAGFAQLGERSGLEIGVSATGGTNNVAASARTKVYGADVKAKLWRSATSYLILQGEVFHLERDEASWDEPTASYTRTTVSPTGGYAYADYNFGLRYNLGGSYERVQQPPVDEVSDQAFKLWLGYALMEETTAIRFDWDHFTPGRDPAATEDPASVNTYTLRVIFSMGPHKAHQF
jgi:hypothetical protein